LAADLTTLANRPPSYMLILPLAPHLRVGRKPIITFGIVILCISIHYHYEYANASATDTAAKYCSAVPTPWLGTESDELIQFGADDCEYTLLYLYARNAREIVENEIEYLRAQRAENDDPGGYERELISLLIHYDEFLALNICMPIGNMSFLIWSSS
jgi:hypothetical protein